MCAAGLIWRTRSYPSDAPNIRRGAMPRAARRLEAPLDGQRDISSVLSYGGLQMLETARVRVRFVKDVPHKQRRVDAAEQLRSREVQVQQDEGIGFGSLDGKTLGFGDRLGGGKDLRDERDEDTRTRKRCVGEFVRRSPESASSVVW